MEMTHSNVCPLDGNDVFFDSWNESYAVQSTMWDNSETWFFGITTGGRRLDRDMVASVFAAQGIGNHICLARVIMNFQLIILDQFYPSSLPHIQVRLSEKILQTFMISVDMH
jgi:hypothetical protein